MAKIKSVGVGSPYNKGNQWAYTIYIDGELYKIENDLADSASAAKQKMREKVELMRRQNGITFRR